MISGSRSCGFVAQLPSSPKRPGRLALRVMSSGGLCQAMESIRSSARGNLPGGFSCMKSTFGAERNRRRSHRKMDNPNSRFKGASSILRSGDDINLHIVQQLAPGLARRLVTTASQVSRPIR